MRRTIRMRRRMNPYPGASRIVDRHGKVRVQFRSKEFSTYLSGPYGSVHFQAAYDLATNGAKSRIPLSGAIRGTLKWLGEQYLRSSRFMQRSDSAKRVLHRELDWLFDEAGDLRFDRFEVRHVEALMAKKSGPAAANKVNKNLSLLFSFAIKKRTRNSLQSCPIC